jgi:hypothetical protein
MFSQILYTQVKWTRTALAMMCVVIFATPAAVWRAASDGFFRSYTALDVMNGFNALGFTLAVLAFTCGFIVVAVAWQVDAITRHVYALSLPIPWSRYVALRFGAGAVLLVLPAFALWLGCLLILSLIDLPATLQAYPTTLALRFLLGSLVAYASVFAVQYLSGKNAAYLLLGVLVAFAVVALGAEATGNRQMFNQVVSWIFQYPGPLAVFGSEWMLIDV